MQEPYLNSNGELVRWKFIEILEVNEAYDDPLKTDVVEVYSELYDKKFQKNIAGESSNEKIRNRIY